MAGFDHEAWRAERIAALDLEERQWFYWVTARFLDLGADDAEGWALSEVTEKIAQMARFLILRRVWHHCIEPHAQVATWMQDAIRRAEQEPTAPLADLGLSLKRLLAAGADPKDLGRFARVIAYETAFDVLNAIDDEYDPEVEDDDLPGWRLMELDPRGELTGRDLLGLHESILGMDPTGREGRPA